jgi:NADH/NAD ratio-sensing transcriptional regulator Rex
MRESALKMALVLTPFTQVVQLVSPQAQAAVVVVQAARVGWALWQHFNRHKRAANAVVKKTDVAVSEVVNLITDDNVMSIDDVSSSITSALDTVDNTITVRRVIRKRSKAPFRAYLVKIGKAKFGLLKRTQANYMCVRKFLYDACVDHGVLARHIVENVDFATELVFVPMAYELERMAIKHSGTVKDHRIVADLLGDEAGDQ